MEQYTSIGKLALKNAVGLQKNRKEIEYRTVSKLDERASGCFECSVYSLKSVYRDHPESEQYISACYRCANCPHRIFKQVVEEHVKYINERHRYGTKIGYSKTLKAIGLKLFIVLHMMHPNRHGHIFNLSISELKEVLGCDRKTVVSNLDKLVEYDYIEYTKTCHRGYVNIILKGYADYFKPAREGGRGYMVFSLELVKALIKIKDLTTLRLFLHQLIDTDNHSETAQSISRKTYQDLLNCLPGYYKPFHIRKGLINNLDNPIFQLHLDDAVTFKLRPEYNAKRVKELLIHDARTEITTYVEELNNKFVLVNNREAQPNQLLNEIYYTKIQPKEYKPYLINKGDIADLAKMAWQYSVYDILDTIDYIYIHFVINNTPIDNLPGLVRTLVPEVRESRKFNSLAA